MTIEQFQKYWDKLETELPMLDLENVYYKDWNERGTRNFGLRHKETHKRHGIIRILTADSMEEATWLQGKRHGFSRQISSSGVVL